MKYAAHSPVVIASVLAETEVDLRLPGSAAILGHKDAPKALVISQLGNAFGTSIVLDELRRPIGKDVFMRMLSDYEIRSETRCPSGAPTKINAAQPAAAAHRRKKP